MTKEFEEKARNYTRGRAMALSFKPLSLQDIEEAYLCGAEDYAHISNPVNSWHKASEELPDPLAYVIVRFSNNTMAVSQMTNHFIGETTTMKVTHWMAIPEIKEE